MLLQNLLRPHPQLRLRVQLHGTREPLVRLFQVAHVQVHDAEIERRGLMGRRGCGGRLHFARGKGKVPRGIRRILKRQLVIADAKIHTSVGIFGLELQIVVVGIDRAGEHSVIVQGVGQAKPRGSIAWIGINRLL